MNLHIESHGKNEVYVNGKQVQSQEYYMEIPDGENILMDVDINGERYAIRDFTINDLEKMLHAPIKNKPTKFAEALIEESNKYIELPVKRSRSRSRSRSKSPKRSSRKSSRKKTSRKSSRRKSSRKSNKKRSTTKSPRQLTIY